MVMDSIEEFQALRHAAETLRASEARYRDLFELSPMSMWEEDFSEVKAYMDELLSQGVTDLKAYLMANPAVVHEAMRRIKILDVNQATLKLFGAESKEDLLEHIDQVLAPATHPLIVEELVSMGQGAAEFEGLGINYKLSGEPMEVALSWFIPGAQKQNLSRIILTIQDVTGPRRAEAALRESEARFRAYIEHSPEGIFVADATGRYLDANPAACALVGYTREEMLSLTVRDMAPPEEAGQGTRFAELLATGTYSGELLLQRKDGTPVAVNLNAAKLPDDTYVGFCVDITQRKDMERELQEERASLARRVAERTAELNSANAELVRAMRAKDDFLATMSHELRTPLTGVLGLSEALQGGTYGALNEKQVRALRMIQTSGEHLLALITDVLDLAKIGADKLELMVEWVPTAEVCQAAMRLVHPQAVKKSIQVTFEMDPAVQYLRADARRFKQMLLNLLGNAVKFTPQGGAVGLQVTGDAQQQRALFTVWDTGIGISADYLQRLFEPFMQVDSSLSRRYEGAGLGLALVRRLAELHGGAVQAESREGAGSRFTILLPWNPADSPAVEIPRGPAETPCPDGAAESEARPRGAATLVLLAEDNELLLRTLGDTLRAKGYEVVAARHGLEALDLARQLRPALILMDIQMPEMDGLEAIRQMRADPALCLTPVIALTALTMPGDREQCLAAGANDYVSKPVRWTELFQKMDDLLGK